MNGILAAVAGLTDSGATLSNVDQLLEVAKKFKPLPVPEESTPPAPEVVYSSEEPWEVELDRCAADPSHQRPLDREKVAAMKKDRTWEREPILVNFDPDDEASYYVLDGQHRAEAARQAGQKTIKAFVKMVPREKEHEHITGIMAKTLAAGDAYEGHVLPSHEPQVIEVLEGLGGERQVSKVETYGWQGRCYVVRCSTGKTITYVPHDAVEKQAGGILTQPERGLLRFDGLTEAEVDHVLKTIEVEVAPVHLPETGEVFTGDAMRVSEVLGITGDVEVLAEGIGGRTWPSDWCWMDDASLIVTNDQIVLARYPVISRHPTGEGDWRLIGPKHDLTVRPA